MHHRFALAAVSLVAVALTVACGAESHERREGEPCELTSDCEAPLVCRLDVCRSECATAADCTAGLSCLFDAEGRGACGFVDSDTCTVDGDCPAPLICVASTCRNECAVDRDCPAGHRCATDPTGVTACTTVADPCVFDSDCEAPRVCGPGGTCTAP